MMSKNRERRERDRPDIKEQLRHPSRRCRALISSCLDPLHSAHCNHDIARHRLPRRGALLKNSIPSCCCQITQFLRGRPLRAPRVLMSAVFQQREPEQPPRRNNHPALGLRRGNEIRLSGLAGIRGWCLWSFVLITRLCRAWNDVSERRPPQWDDGRAGVLLARSAPAYRVALLAHSITVLVRGILALSDSRDMLDAFSFSPRPTAAVDVDVEVRCFLPGGEIDMLT